MKLKYFFACLVFVGLASRCSSANAEEIKYTESTSGQTEVIYNTDSKKEPTYQGLPIGQWLEKNTQINPNHLSLKQLMTLKQVGGEDEYGIVQFELPVKFDSFAATNLSGAHVDIGGMTKEGEFAEFDLTETEGATNGNFSISWNTTFDPPKKYHVRARLIYQNGWDSIEVIGPPLQFESTNACQFFESDSVFDKESAFLDAQLSQKKATYTIQLFDPSTNPPKLMHTVHHSTANGIIQEDWKFQCDDGATVFTGRTFNAVFQIKFPDGKTNTLTHVLNKLGP